MVCSRLYGVGALLYKILLDWTMCNPVGYRAVEIAGKGRLVWCRYHVLALLVVVRSLLLGKF